MKYTVAWIQQAQDALASVWLAAADRNAVARAANTIDRLLQWSPQLQGQLLFDTVRVLSISPLTVEYEVIEADRLVYVIAVYLAD